MKQTVFFPPSCVASSFGEKVGLDSQTLGSWAFCFGEIDSLGALDKKEWERERRGENIFYSTSVCVYYAFIWWNLIPAVQPTVPSAATAPFGRLPILS